MPILQGQPTRIDDGLTPVERVLRKLERVKKSSTGWTASCPVAAGHKHGDRNPSLSITEGKDGRALVNCHTGCATRDVVAAIGLEMRDLFPIETSNGHTSAPRSSSNGHRRIVATYNYYDEDGTLLFQTLRYDPKDFRQRRPDGHGGWHWNLENTKRVLYRLPELTHAPVDRIVYICEGEKDVDNLRALGLVATCNPMGAGKWHRDYCEYLRDRYVVILEDNDDAGRAHAQEVAEALTGTATMVKLVRLPDLPDKGDASDWLSLGGTAAQLEILAANAPEWQTAEGEDRFPIHWASEALLPPPPVEWVVENLLSRGCLSAFVGDAGTKKTWLLLSLAICIAKGMDWLGHSVTQGTVLIIDEESGHRRLHNRLHSLMVGYGCLEPLPLAWITSSGFDLRNPTDVLKMRRRIEEIQPVFVVVDALMEVIAGADENSSQEVLPAIKTFRTIGQEYNFASGMIHHANKAGGYRGSSSIKGVVDQMLMISSRSDDPIVTIASEKVRDTEDIKLAAEAHFVDFPQRKVWFTSAGYEAPEKHLSNSKLVVTEYIAQHFRFSVKDLLLYAEERGICSPDAARMALYDFARDGKVKRANTGGRGTEAQYERA